MRYRHVWPGVLLLAALALLLVGLLRSGRSFPVAGTHGGYPPPASALGRVASRGQVHRAARGRGAVAGHGRLRQLPGGRQGLP